MNYADARRVATEMEKLGYRNNPDMNTADVVVVQTCTVRQQSEDKAYNKIVNLKPLKDKDPSKTIAVMGCVVGVRGNETLEETFPFVDVFMEPSSDGKPLIQHLQKGEDLAIDKATIAQLHAWQDGEVILPADQRGEQVTAPVAIVYGCSHACSFCIIPQKRGIERSRPIGSIAAEVRSLVAQGVKEVMLLGQIVDRYGTDVEDGPTLADLFRVISGIDGLERIRFLTSHPNYMTDEILHAIADLPKVMPQIEVPIQAGDNDVLHNMKREYTREQYRDLVHRIRTIVPDAAINCDIIVGFPGETDEQFQRTYDILEELRLSKVHLARYSPRPGTVSDRRMEDDVSDAEKRRRYHLIEGLQKRISEEKMTQWMDQELAVLVEERHKGRWRGRTPQGKLIFFDDPRELKGEMVTVRVTHTGAWSLSGEAVDRPEEIVAEMIPLSMM